MYKIIIWLIVVQSLSRVWLFATPWIAAHQASLSFIISQSLLQLISIESVMPSNRLIFCCPPLLLPSVFPSIRVFSSELALHIRWTKYWSFSLNISPSNEYSGLISFRIDWSALLPSWNDYHNKFGEHPLSYRYKNWRNRNFFLLVVTQDLPF